MKQFLIGSFILAFLLGPAPAMAERYDRGEPEHKANFQKVERDQGAPKHKKFLTSRYRDDYGHRDGHRGKHGWKGHPGRHHGWKKQKRHHKWHGYHGHQRHWDKHHYYHDRRYSKRHHHGRDHGTRYRFHYNGLIGADVGSGQIVIDLSRH
jgi:hypothetical protein